MMKKILKRVKKYVKSVKGFTLIEMIGVIVIMGLIMIVVFPTMSKMINSNANEKYSNYYEIIEEGAQVYAGNLGDELGNSTSTGCTEITLKQLVDEGYIKSLDEKKVNCKTASGNIKIRNNKGSISVNFQLNCSSNGKDVYINGKNDTSTCKAYVMKEEINIKTKLETMSSSLGIYNDPNSSDVYITANGNNYIWYSGKLWRIVSYNKTTEVVKAVTVDPVVTIYYNHENSSNYSSSDVETWLNNEFLVSLKDYQSFLTSSSWNTTANTDISKNPITNSKVKRARVGLISTYEFGRIKAWYGNDISWLLSEGTNNKSLYSQSGAVKSVASNTMYGIRPAVTFSSDVLVHSGSGSSTDPFIIDNTSNSVGVTGDLLSSRYSGEYVKIGSNNYRIISTNGGFTKVIGLYAVGPYQFSDNHFDYSASTMRTTVEKLSQFGSDLIVTGDFCNDTINNANLAYHSSKCLTAERINTSIKIGLPKIGEMFTTSLSGVTNNYWTLNPNTETDTNGNHYNSTINVIKPTGEVTTSTITATNYVVPVFYLDSDVKISGGKGMSSSPYTLTR